MEALAVDILMNTARLGDATSQHTFALARTLLDADCDVRLLTNFPNGPLPVDLRDRIHQLHPADYQPTRALTIVEYPLWYPLAERIRHAPGARVFWYHGVTDPALWPTQAGVDVLRNSLARTSLAWHAHLAIATSPFTAAELRRHSKVPAERLRIVPLGVDLSAFAAPMPTDDIAGLRKKLALENARVLLYVGRCAEHKRIDLMIDALAQLIQQGAGDDVHLLLVGDTDSTVETSALVTRLQRHAADLGVTDRVTFTGRVEAVEPYYQLADLYLQASQHEGFGVPLVEAMAAGVPVVAGASGAIPWVLGADEDGPAAGLLFPPGDASALTAQIQRLLGDPALCNRLRAQGQARAQTFGMAHFARTLLQTLAEAVEIARQGPPESSEQGDPLYAAADVVLRDFRVRSGAPVIGPLIEWTRTNVTTHIKEGYWDRMFEEQVNYNRQLAEQVIQLRHRLSTLRTELKALAPESQPLDPPL